MTQLPTHERMLELKSQGRTDEATKVCLEMLDHDVDNAGALFQLASLMSDQNSKGLAYNLLARAAKLAPEVPEIWMQYGKAHPDKPEWWGRTEWCLRKAIKVGEKHDKKMPLAWAHLGMLYYVQGKYSEARRYIDQGLSIDPTHDNSLLAKSFVHLARGEWDAAWEHYDILLKSHRRESYAYGDEPTWAGEPVDRIVINGEQGIGDEILYASCFGSLMADVKDVVIDCMPRLKTLFARSFPEAKVIGTRWDKEVFLPEDFKPDAHAAMASLPQYYRHRDEDFPGTPYLKADPDMRSAFRGMLAELGDVPKIGIAWTGGTDRTRGYLRTRTLEELTPLLRQNAVWVSMEYRDRSEEIAEYREKRGIDIHVFDWITRKGLDYDLTAALVAELDLVLTVPSAISQTAGALGVESWILAPRYVNWLFARDKFVWADSVQILHNLSMGEIAGKLSDWLDERKTLTAVA